METTKTVGLPVKYKIYSLPGVISKGQDPDRIEAVEALKELLDDTRQCSTNDGLREELEEIRDDIVKILKELPEKSEIEKYVLSLKPKRRLRDILSLNVAEEPIDFEISNPPKYFIQVLKARNQRRFLGKDLSKYDYVSGSFNTADQLLGILENASLIREQQLLIFRQLATVDSLGEVEGSFTIKAEKISKLREAVDYVLDHMEVVGTKLLVTSIAALSAVLVAGYGSVTGTFKSLTNGIRVGYSLQNKIVE